MFVTRMWVCWSYVVTALGLIRENTVVAFDAIQLTMLLCIFERVSLTQQSKKQMSSAG